MESDLDLNELILLDMEYKLTVGVAIARNDEDCAWYLIRRRSVLLPEILKTAKEQGKDPVLHFADYARGVHTRLCESED